MSAIGLTPARCLRLAAALVAGYVLLLFGQRAVFPDISCDTINYHFSLGKAAVDHFPHLFHEAEFYPLGMHSLNPTLDALNYLLSQQLGYRLGTLGSVLALLGCLVVTLRMATRIIGERLPMAAVLLIVPALIVHEGLFQVATYYTDNIYALLVLLSVALLLDLGTTATTGGLLAKTTLLGVLAGLLCTKLTNLIYVLPLLAATFAAVTVALRDRRHPRPLVVATVACGLYALAMLPWPGLYALDAYLQTGNPVFPYYNNIFHSPYYPTSGWSFNFGPATWPQRVVYPFFALADPTLLGEVKDLFPDVKLITAWLVFLALLAACLHRRQRWPRSESFLILITLAAFLLWQGIFGYVRYAIALEYLLGLAIAVLAVRLWPSGWPAKWLLILYGLLAVGQSAAILSFNTRYDLAWRPAGQPAAEIVRAWSSPALFAKQTHADPHTTAILDQVEVVLHCVSPSSAYPATFPELRDKPMLNLYRGSAAAMPYTPDYARRRDAAALNALGKHSGDPLRFAAVVNDTNKPLQLLDTCLHTLAQEQSGGRPAVHLTGQLVVDNFVGDPGQRLHVLLGEYRPVLPPSP